MTHLEFFEAYKSGQRIFSDLDFEYLDGFSNKNFSDTTFENCFLYLDFRCSNLTNAKFIGCNIKEIDLRQANLTNALITNCLVESAMFKGSTVNGFKFIDNYFYGSTLNQDDFDKILLNSDAYVLKKELSKIDFQSTLSPKMTDVTEAAEPKIDIWPFVKDLVYENIVDEYVLSNHLVEKVYRNQLKWCDHVLLPTRKKNSYVVILVDIECRKLLGFYQLDLNAEYSIQ